MRPNQALVDLDALRHNARHARALAPASQLMAVVKANAYGHGIGPAGLALEPLVDALAVACTEEAQALRAAGVTAPIALLEGAFSADEVGFAQRENCWLTVDNEQQLHWLEQASLPAPVTVWLKIDTGMHRLGMAPAEVGSAYRRLRACPNVADGIVLCTHFASADQLASDQTRNQLAAFAAACRGIEAPRSTANSPALLAWPQAHLDWVRPGYMLYGNSPFDHDHPNTAALRHVMTLKSAVISVREVAAGEAVGYGASWVARRTSRVATVTIGYGDGYPRRAANGTPVLVNGRRAPLAGRVSMDMITVDVTDVGNVAIGDEVILWGPQLPAAEVARHADTIGYELTTRMPARTPRVYLGGRG
jgi:alanine racemase